MNTREKLEEAFFAGVEAVEPRRLVREWLEGYDVAPTKVFALGKAALIMTKGALDVHPLLEGSAVTTYRAADTELPDQIEIRRAGHPIPDEKGLLAGIATEELLKDLDEEDTLLVLISGGGSALLPTTRNQISLDEMKDITFKLLEKGATIQDMNCIRRHLEVLKGGGMVQTTKAKVITLVLSDVIGDDLESIASGPTAPDPTTCSDAKSILQHYGVKIPAKAWSKLSSGEWETAKPDDPIWDRVENHIIANNDTALYAAAGKLEELFGMKPFIVQEPMTGEAREEGKKFAELVRKHDLAIGGGETVVFVMGGGTGGRNQEMALSNIGEECDGTLLFASTDGIDGPTDAAGAFCDNIVRRNAQDQRLDPKEFLDDNNSHAFFSKTNGLLKTGTTGTNVCDLALGYKS